MAFVQFITAFLFALALAKVHPSACHVVKGKVTCEDCTDSYDFSGIMVSVKCEGVKKLSVVTAEDNGSFKVDLPLDHNKLHHHLHPSSVNCHVKLLGGPNHIYASRKNQISQIVKGNEGIDSYTISTPLSFFQFCPQHIQHCNDANMFDSSKTFYFSLPPEWGLAPSSFYFPFFPIIGIP